MTQNNKYTNSTNIRNMHFVYLMYETHYLEFAEERCDLFDGSHARWMVSCTNKTGQCRAIAEERPKCDT